MTTATPDPSVASGERTHPVDEPTPSPATGWTLWAVLRRPAPGASAAAGTTARPALAEAIAALPGDVTVRGVYDTTALRADAAIMVWLHGTSAEAIQDAWRALRATVELHGLEERWNALGVDRPAEFSRNHVPAFLRGAPPRRWLTVYPFVRSYDWYLLPTEERAEMLREHGGKGRVHEGVLSNTVASFALGDYEWLLGLESDELVELVDLMRDLRQTEARRHVREEVPFFTGRRIEADEVAGVLAL